MARRRSGDKPLSEPMMVNLLTDKCITRPQRVNIQRYISFEALYVFSKSYFNALKLVSDAYWCITLSWASYQIRKIVGCACAGNAGNVFPATNFKWNRYLAIPACITARASRTCRDACWDRKPTEAGKTFSAFPAHAQPTILRIWQEAHSQVTLSLWSYTYYLQINADRLQ